jgi:hypothetical protein
VSAVTDVLDRRDSRDHRTDPDSPSAFERGPQKYLPAAVGILVAIFASRLFVQLGHPFLSHDDWDNLLPPDEYRERLMWNRLLFEGRWLNWGLWHLGGWVLTPITATALYFGAYAAFVLRFAQRLVPGWWGVVVAAALFVSPMVCEAGYWPAILGPSMVVLALAAWTLPLLRHRTGWLLAWLGFFTLLAMLSYQPVALLLFLMLMVEERQRSIRQLAALAIAFVGAWGASIAVTFTLNWFAFGVFGVEPQAWRKPNPLEDVNDLFTNLGVAGGHFALIFTTLPVPILLGLAAIAGCLAVRSLRKHAVVLLLATLVMAGLESVSTIVGGFVTPFRSSMWVWVVIVVAISYLITAGRGVRAVIAAAAAAAVAVSGSLYWAGSVATKQERLSEYDGIASDLGRVLADKPGARITIVGSERDWKWPIFAQQATYLQSRTIDEYGIKPSLCKPARCRLARDPDVVRRDSNVFVVGKRIVVRPPASRG